MNISKRPLDGQAREAASWDVIECDVCGAPVLLLADQTGDYFAAIHLDRDSLEDLVAVLIDLEGGDEDISPNEETSMRGPVRGEGSVGWCACSPVSRPNGNKTGSEPDFWSRVGTERVAPSDGFQTGRDLAARIRARISRDGETGIE